MAEEDELLSIETIKNLPKEIAWISTDNKNQIRIQIILNHFI